jgi:hypothetical protein
MAKKVLTSTENGADSLSDINANYTELYTGQEIVQSTAKTTPVDADLVGLVDSVSGLLNKLSFLNLKKAITSWNNPIGTLREFNVATNPATLLGIGTWSAYGTGRVTVAIDAGQTEFDTVDETGGEKTHQLTEAELASHDHPGVAVSLKNDNPTDGDRLHGGSDHAGTAGLWTPTVGDAGSDTAHNNVQPYIVVYRWVRVS